MNRTDRTALLPSLLALALAACGGSGGTGGGGPTLESVSLDADPVYAVVGTQQQLTLTGHYADGSSAPLTQGVVWTTTDRTVVSVDDRGLLTPWSHGQVRITATDAATGLSAEAALTARAVVALAAGEGLRGRVDTGTAYFHVTGLTPGAIYTPSVSDLSDDVDVEVYSDLSMIPETRLCRSGLVGRLDEACFAPAGPAGDLWIAVDGGWTRSGATFDVDVPAAAPVTLAATLAAPDGLPYAGAVGATRQFVKVTGLAPGAVYTVRLSNLAVDLDLEVYGTGYHYGSLCESFHEGVEEDACEAAANPAGALYVEIDGETTIAGGAYTLTVTPR